MNVSIPQWCDCCAQIQNNRAVLTKGFNPTMVRLLLCNLKQIFPPAHVSIPQWCDCCCPQHLDVFVPVVVSIPQWCDCCRLITTLSIAFTSSVSIPQWCDCCPDGVEVPLEKAVVSIPQWCDCCTLASSNTALTSACFNPTMVRLLRK